MKKIIIIPVLLMITLGCSLFDPDLWERAEQRRERRGRTCYEDYSGYFYCEDTYDDDGNLIRR